MSAEKPIPLFRSRVTAEARARLLATLDSGWLGYGPECAKLEAAFSEGRDGWALATSSCTSALYLAGRIVRATATVDAPEIVVPALTFVASAMAFLQAGVRPVLSRVHADSLLIDAAAVRRAVTPHTRAILAVHLYGQRCANLAQLRRVADEHDLLLIEDCAHRVDVLDAQAPLGDVLCYSFNAVKELPCGEGGLIWGRDASHEPHVRAVSNLGLCVDTMQRAANLRHADYAFADEPGLKLRSSDVCASLVNAGLAALPAQRAQRREVFRRYDALLDRNGLDALRMRREDDDSFLMYVVKLPASARDAVRDRMARFGVATSVHYPSLARHPLLGCASADALCADQDASIVTLPTSLELTVDDQERVIATLAAALASARATAGA